MLSLDVIWSYVIFPLLIAAITYVVTTFRWTTAIFIDMVKGAKDKESWLGFWSYVYDKAKNKEVPSFEDVKHFFNGKD